MLCCELDGDLSAEGCSGYWFGFVVSAREDFRSPFSTQVALILSLREGAEEEGEDKVSSLSAGGNSSNQ